MTLMSSRAVVNFLATGFARLISGQGTNSRTKSGSLYRTALHALILPWLAFASSAAWAAVLPTATTLTISSTSVLYKTPITLTASVKTSGVPVTSGFVLFCDASATVCENNSALATVQLTSATATATLKLGSGPLGVHSYKAVFRPNNLYSGSSSNTVSYSVTGTYASTTSIASAGSVSNYSLTGTVAGIGSVLAGPTGNVSFLDASAGNNLLGIQALGSSALSTTFQAAPGSPFAIANSSTTRRSVAIASAYLNGDDNLDVVTGDAQQTITVLLGNGDGTFQPKVNYAGCPSGKALKILLADFNRDGNSDVALGCSDGTNGSLTILLGNGDGTFGAPTSYTAGDVAGIAVGDFNGDGLVDVVVSNKQQQNVMLFIGNGSGTFSAGTTLLSPPSALHDVVVADFNSDGKDDLLYAITTAVSGSPLSDLYIATGNGDGTFTTPVVIASQVGEFLSAGDTNGDGFQDVVSTTINGTPPNVGPSLFVVIGNGDGTFKPKVIYTSDIPSDPHLADVNGDGKPDIIAGGSYGELVYEGNGDGTFKPYTEPTIGDFALTYAVQAGDFNNDGNADLIGTDADTPRAAVSLSQVTQSATSAALTGVALYPLGSGTHNVDASYEGNSIYTSSLSTTIPLLAAPAPTTLTLAVSPTAATLSGSSLTMTATLSPYAVGPPNTTTNGDPVKFYNGASQIGTGTLNNGVATFTTTSLPVGSDALKAIYPGDPNYLTSTSSTINVTVTNIVISSSVNPSAYLQSVTFTATVATGLTGSVTFNDGATALCTTALSGSTATCTTSALTVGLHNITGVYSGDGTHSAATSPVLVQEVDKATPTVVVTTSGPSTYGDTVTVTATVPAGTTGTVTFTSGGNTIGSGTISGGTVSATTSTLPVGTDTITASYGGDTNNNPATGTVNQTVGKATPVLPAPGVNPGSPVAGSPVTITETVPTGVSGPVTFYNGGTSIGTAPIVGGVATLTVPSLPTGTDSITASTPGDTNNNPATSPATSVTVTKITPTVTVTTSGPSTYGSPVTITASVPAGTTGTVTITSGGVTLGSGTVSSGGTVTVTTSSLPAGTDTITASYGGDSNNNSATGTTTQIVSLNTPIVTVTTSGPSNFGSPVTITASVPTGTTGTITLTSGGTTLGSGTVSPAGTVTVTTSTLPVGTDTITANYGGDSNNNPAIGSTTQTVSKATTTLTLTSSSNPSTSSQPVTFTATVPTTATGTVTFSNGSTVLGTGTVTNGVATLTTSALPAGSDTITATYSGDTNNSTATGTLTQTVNKNTPVLPPPGVTPTSPDTLAPVTITETVPAGVSGPVTFYDGGTVIGTAPIVGGVATLTVPPLSAGSHTITASTPGDANNNPATSPATTVTVTKATPVLPAPVVSNSNPVAGTTITITETVPAGVTGPVTFSNGGTVIGTAPIVGGVATITTSTLPLGPNPITASTPANSTFNAATSPATTVTVAKGPGTVTLTSSANPATLSQPVTFTAVVNTGATGTVTFYDGATVLGVGTISGAGVATFTTSTLGSGTHSITAVSSGDATYGSGTSAPLNQVVSKTPTVTAITQSTNIQLLHTMVTFTANVTAPSPTPTGMVTFFDGGTAIGTSALNTNGTATVSFSTVGNAAYATNSLATGTHQITATYSGDTGFMPSTSLPVANVVADFTIAATGTTTQKLFPGDSTSYTFLVTPVGGSTFLYDTTVTIDGLPAGTDYTFSPAIIAAGSGATTVTLKLTVSNAHHAANQVPAAPGSKPGSNRFPVTLAILGLAGMGAIRRHRKQMPRLLMLLLLCAASLLPVAAVTGCAGGYFALDPTVYSLNVTGTEATIKHAATTTLVVQ